MPPYTATLGISPEGLTIALVEDDERVVSSAGIAWAEIINKDAEVETWKAFSEIQDEIVELELKAGENQTPSDCINEDNYHTFDELPDSVE